MMLWSRLSGALARRRGRGAGVGPPAGEAPAAWKESLRLFFAQRADSIDAAPTLEDLCYISGRDPRLWADPALLEDLVRSLVEQAALDTRSSLLEVGCAAGFIARAIAPRVARYTGVDLAADALRVAARLGLPNATFEPTDGARLPFADGSFDASLCYDVFTNFPRFRDGEGILAEMVRVVRPGGRALVGSIPDAAKRDALQARAVALAAELDASRGALRARPEAATHAIGGVSPGIVCYDFAAEDFVAFGKRIGARAEILDIHRRNPYHGLRFNVVYHKPAA